MYLYLEELSFLKAGHCIQKLFKSHARIRARPPPLHTHKHTHTNTHTHTHTNTHTHTHTRARMYTTIEPVFTETD
jgi:hypothetical protein